MRVIAAILLVTVVSIAGGPRHAAAADRVATWNQTANTFEAPPGVPFGSLQSGLALSTVDPAGVPISQPPFSITLVIGSLDGKRYRVTEDGRIIPEEEEEDDEDPGAGAEGGSAGGSGGGSGGSGGSDGGNGGGSHGVSGGGNAGGPAPPSINPNGGIIPAPNPFEVPRDGEGLPPGSQPSVRAHDSVTDFNGKLNRLAWNLHGWSRLSHGRSHPPALTDGADVRTNVPALFYDPKDKKRPSLLQNDLAYTAAVPQPKDISVDREILRTSMAVFQPTRRIQRDFLEWEQGVNDYLGNANTMRGVALMTMGFLDKTVGAGLTAIQQQADQNTIQQLLKQMSWATNRLVNDEQAQIYRDVDEKLEACLEIALTEKSAPRDIKGKTRSRVDFTCHESCGLPPRESATKNLPYRVGEKADPEPKFDFHSKRRWGSGSYAYCVCCAETDAKLNYSRETPDAKDVIRAVKESPRDKSWSLFDRLFFGVGAPRSQTMMRSLRQVKLIYGDYVLLREDSTKEPSFGLELRAPEAPPAKLVAMYTDLCRYDPEGKKPLVSEGTCADLGAEFNVPDGCYNAVGLILENFQKILRGEIYGDQLAQWWAQVSWGGPMTARYLRQILAMNGDAQSDLKRDEARNRMLRYIRVFCQESAVAAVVRLHTSYSALIDDLLAANHSLSASDKNLVRELRARVSDAISLAEADSSSRFKVDSLETDSSIEWDRRMTADIASFEQAITNIRDLETTASGTTQFTRGMFCQGANCGAGSSGGASPSPDTLSGPEVPGDPGASPALTRTPDSLDRISGRLGRMRRRSK